ncbi:hypothetical protein CHARACLAT_021186 [Characodon lateralis]|uniref:Uncharacterized protein n=1 Tax=Characodon lateralis TaxID=208331 RepID=A0ABU7EDF0_9TELE|nr:hypothetical protein [Characodon lateralis]
MPDCFALMRETSPMFFYTSNVPVFCFLVFLIAKSSQDSSNESSHCSSARPPDIICLGYSSNLLLSHQSFPFLWKKTLPSAIHHHPPTSESVDELIFF